MEKTHQTLLNIAKDMASGDIEGLRKLRTMVVDLDLTKEISDDYHVFTVLYLSKKLTGDVWENLATDASFDFDEEQLKEFTIGFGSILLDMLTKNAKILLNMDKLSEPIKLLYTYFAKISADPNIVQRGGGNGPN